MIQQIVSNKNRILRVLEDCNIKLSNILSNARGVVDTNLIDKLCAGEVITMENINQVYHSKLKASREELYEACQGLVTDHNIYLLQMIRQDIFEKKVIIAIRHSILKSVYHVICEEKAYRELGAFLCQ